MSPSWLAPLTWRQRLLTLRLGMVLLLALSFLTARLLQWLPLSLTEVSLWLLMLLSPSVLLPPTAGMPNRWQTVMLAIEACLDLVLFTGLVMQLGGAANPMGFYLLLPTLVASMALPLWSSWGLAMVACAGYGLTLRVDDGGHLQHALQHALTDAHPQHLLGMWITFCVIAVVLLALGQLLRRAQQREQRHHGMALEVALQRERMYQVAASLADRAHELNTPLSTLVLLSESMQDHPGLPDDLREDADHLADLARQVSLRLRPESSRPSQESGPLPLSRLCDDLARTLRHLSPGLTVSFDGPSDPPLHNPAIWQRVFSNLGYNACDAGAEQLRLSCEPDASGWRIRVCDDGPSHAPSGRSGLGIGLALVQSGLAALGAELELTHDAHQTCAVIQLRRGDPA